MSPDKYDIYVWPAVAITALIVAWMIIDSFWRARRWKRRVDELQAQKDAAKAAAMP